ncbi:MAG TPA: hypothetical protein PLB89_18210 [Flavobacteriales bacterium]|nr:hypothetical protein [Flavobacteriales bacterium]
MKFQGKTYQCSNPTVRDLAHKLKLHVEKGTYRSAAHLQNAIIDDLVPDGWPADTHVRRDANEISVCVGRSRVCVLGFSHKLITKGGTGNPLDVLIKVRRAHVDSYVATADGGMKATSTSSHENAVRALVERFLGQRYKAVRAKHHDQKYFDPKRETWQQVQCYRIEKS